MRGNGWQEYGEAQADWWDKRGWPNMEWRERERGREGGREIGSKIGSKE